MLDGKKAYALARKYVDDSLAGAGAVAGVPCQIQSITPITGGNRVTFLWEDNNGDSHTSTMDVMNGEKGETGETGATGNGIKSMTINSAGHVIVTYDNDDTEDAGLVPTVQADWNEADSTANSYIKNKPTLGTASAKDSTDTVRPNSHDLVESNAVANAINQALTSVYTPRGDLSCAELTSELLIAENVGNVYEMSDAGTTSALFIQGAGIPISQGNNVGIIKASADTYMFNYMGNSFDLHDYQKKDLASSIEGASTVEGALGALSTNKATQAEVNDIVNVLGAKNLLPFPYESGQRSIQGLTFSFDNKNGVVVSGTNTSSSTAGYNFEYQRDISNFIGKTITISVENAPVNADAYCPFIIKNSLDEIVARYDIDSEHPSYTFTVPSTATTYDFQLYVRVGKSVNATLYPMIRLASDPDNTYVPYAMTNRELTESKAKIIYGTTLWSANTPVTITLPRLGGLLVGGRDNKGFAIYVCENGNELVVLSGGDFVTASISDLAISLTFSSVYGSSFNWKYINSETGSY